MTDKEKVEILEAEVVDELADPGYDFKEPWDKRRKRKDPRGTRKKDYPAFTEANRNRILQYTSVGVPPKFASMGAGLAPDTLDRWLDKGKDCQERLEAGEALLPVERDFAEFYTEYNRIAGLAIISLVANIREAAKRDPRIALKLLEKTAPDEYGPRQDIRMSGKVEQDSRILVGVCELDGREIAKKLTTDELKQLRADITKRKALAANNKKGEGDDT
jgi:hypothetical protein